MRRSMIPLIALSLVAVLAGTAGAAEICGNGLDDDADDRADEGCTSEVCVSPLGCTQTGMISVLTGALTYQLPADIAPRSPWGPSIAFTRTYQSQYAPGGGAPAYRKPLGERWGHTYSTWLDSVSSTKVVLHLSNGRDTLLQRTSTTGGYNTFTLFQPGFHAQYLRQQQAAPSNWELKLLTGEVLVYNSSGKLIEQRDTLATPNKVLLTYDGSGMLSTVTDATAKRRLQFSYASSLMSSVAFQLDLGGTWTTQHTTTYGYTSGNLTSVTIGGELAQTNTYTSSYLTQIDDGGGKQIVRFIYSTATAGRVVYINTSRGVVGFEFNSSRASCSGKTVVYFNRGLTSSCNVDSDCGAGYLCGGKYTTGSTGQCFRAARCLTTSSPSEDVVTAVSALGPPGESCTGACAEVGAYVWTTGTSTLDLKATQDGAGSFTSRKFNANGLPIEIHHGDADSDPTNTNSARVEYVQYNTTYPGKVEMRWHKSDLTMSPTCSSSSTGLSDAGGCAKQVTLYNSDGLISETRRLGYTLSSSNSVVGGTNEVTTYAYAAYGRVSQISGPLGSLTSFAYVTGSDPTSNGFLGTITRKVSSTENLTTTYSGYDLRGNATVRRDPDTTYSCTAFNAARGTVASQREMMSGQDCVTSGGTEIVTSFTYDTLPRVTRVNKPDGLCVDYEYDSKGRVEKIWRRDDCGASSAGDRQFLFYSADDLLTTIENRDTAGNLTAKRILSYYDGRQLERIVNAAATSVGMTLTYDQGGLVVTVDGAAIGGVPASKTEYTIDADRRTTTVTKYETSSTTDTWSIANAWGGEQTSVTDGDSKVTGSLHDDFGRLVRITSPDLTGGPILFLYNALGLRTTRIDAQGGASARTHNYTFDLASRPLNDDHPESCSTTEVQRKYDAPPVTCPSTCNNTTGRLAWVKVTLACAGGYDGGALTQETFYSYDAMGRVTREYVRDNSHATTPRISDHQYAWTKGGKLEQVTLPSGAVHGWTYGAAGNSDGDRISAVWRTNSSSPIADQVTWYPFGELKQYRQQNTYTAGGSTLNLQTRIVRDANGDVTRNIIETTTSSVAFFRIDPSRDANRRVVRRDYDNSFGMVDSYFLYDMQDRLLCETTSSVTSCPTSGTNIKNSHSASPPFTNAGDWKQLLRPIPGSTGQTHVFNGAGYGSSHQIVTVAQSDGTPTLGTTSYVYDAYGNRSYDVNTGLAHDRRDYTYDSRGNVLNVRGQYRTGGAWHYYNVGSMYDAGNRRVVKTFNDESTGETSMWFFFYYMDGRLAEARYTPNLALGSVFSSFELFWMDGKPVLWWQTDYPGGATSKRYLGADERHRQIFMHSWPSSGNPVNVWAVDQSILGDEAPLIGAGLFQPLWLARTHRDSETIGWRDDGITVHRSALASGLARTYDAWSGSMLQVEPGTKSYLSPLFESTRAIAHGNTSNVIPSIRKFQRGWLYYWVYFYVDGGMYCQPADWSPAPASELAKAAPSILESSVMDLGPLDSPRLPLGCFNALSYVAAEVECAYVCDNEPVCAILSPSYINYQFVRGYDLVEVDRILPVAGVHSEGIPVGGKICDCEDCSEEPVQRPPRGVSHPPNGGSGSGF